MLDYYRTALEMVLEPNGFYRYIKHYYAVSDMRTDYKMRELINTAQSVRDSMKKDVL